MRLPFFSAPSRIGNLALTGQEQASATSFLQRLVQTPGLPGCEGDVARLIADELHAVGVDDVQVDPVGSVIARLGDGSGPTLLLDAHMDTVEATDVAWLHDPFGAVIGDGVLHGLGACDMKGAMAAIVYGARRLIQTATPLHGTLLLAFVVQQEPCEGCAIRELLAGIGVQPDWTIIGGPTNLELMLGHRGRVLFKVTVRGRSSHASTPELGENAIVAASRLIFNIDLLASTLVPTDPFLGGGTITVTHIESVAPSKNAIPNACTLYIDRRLTLGETPSRAQKQIETIIQREGVSADIEIVEYHQPSYTGHPIRTREAFNAWLMDETHPLAKSVGEAIQSVLGRAPAPGRWPFSTDGVYTFAEAGIPTVGFGPGDPQFAHSPDEHIALDDVFRAAQVYAAIAASLLSGS